MLYDHPLLQIREVRTPFPPNPLRGPHVFSKVKSTNILGVFGLSVRTTERDLQDEFSRHGEIEKVVIVYDQRVSRSRSITVTS